MIDTKKMKNMSRQTMLIVLSMNKRKYRDSKKGEGLEDKAESK